MRRARRRWWFYGSGILLLAAAGVGYVVWLHPWLARPDASVDRIEARWRKVEQWAAPRKGLGRVERLRRAQHTFRAAGDPLEGDDRGPPLPTLNREKMGEDVGAALDELTRWYQLDGGLGAKACATRDDLRADILLSLGRVALSSAEHRVDSPRFLAVLHLATVLRNAGTLVQGMVGLLLFRDAVRWMRNRGIAPNMAVEASAPRPDALFRLLAREAKCWMDESEAVLGEAQPLVGGYAIWPQGMKGSSGLPWPPFGLVSIDRELLVARKFFSDRLHQASAHRREPDALLRFARRTQGRWKRAHSPLVTLLHHPWPPVIERWNKMSGRVERMLARLPAVGYRYGTCWQPERESARDCKSWCREQNGGCGTVCREGSALVWGPNQREACRAHGEEDRRSGDGSDVVDLDCGTAPIDPGSWVRCCCGPSTQ